jgi:hypothetical protein
MSNGKSSNIIGTFELVTFPEFGTSRVTAKIDTGAYTGALHCSKIGERDIEGGKTLVFIPLGSTKVIEKDEFIIKYVRSSNGKRQKRYFISTQIIVQKKTYEITLSLADRSEMKRPVLIGRRFLKQHHFLVDPTRANRYVGQTNKDKPKHV